MEWKLTPTPLCSTGVVHTEELVLVYPMKHADGIL